MLIEDRIQQISKLNDLYSSGQFGIDETNDMDDMVDLFREEMKQVIRSYSTNELREVLQNEDWIIVEDLDGVHDSELHIMACNALHEDLDYVLHGCKFLLGIKNAD